MHGCMLDHVRSAHDMVSFVDCLGQFQLGTCIVIIRCWPHRLVQDVERQPLVLLNVVCKFLRFFFTVSDRSPGAFRDRASSTGPLAWQSVSVFPPLALLHSEAAFFFYCCFLCSIFFSFFLHVNLNFNVNQIYSMPSLVFLTGCCSHGVAAYLRFQRLVYPSDTVCSLRHCELLRVSGLSECWTAIEERFVLRWGYSFFYVPFPLPFPP